MAGHSSTPRGLQEASAAGATSGRFGRMFPDLEGPEHDPGDLLRLAKAMFKPEPDAGAPIDESEPIDENPTIEAGFTYFGQFVDHDLTLDTTSLSGQQTDAGALIDFRTPALDLDCIYGRGPGDQPYLYVDSDVDGVEAKLLRLGQPFNKPTHSSFWTRSDVLRINELPEDSTAILGDKRNDENKIVSQFQSVFIEFHNRASRDENFLKKCGVRPLDNPDVKFDAVVRAIRWHYQYVVLNDLVAKLVQPGTIEAILNGNNPVLKNYESADFKYPYLPIEFSGAAYRLGHSMVRPSYSMNFDARFAKQEDDGVTRIPIFGPKSERNNNLNGFGPQRLDWSIDWRFFLSGVSSDRTDLEDAKVPQPSYRLDANLVDPLAALPEFEGRVKDANLAFRNLLRGSMLRLPTGEQVAARLGITPLDADRLYGQGSIDSNVPPKDSELAKKIGDIIKSTLRMDAYQKSPSLRGKTPLWYYILREAEYFGVNGTTLDGAPDPAIALGGHHLGPVGSRIVAETFIALLWHDPGSYLHAIPRFEPAIETNGQPLKLADIVRYATG